MTGSEFADRLASLRKSQREGNTEAPKEIEKLLEEWERSRG